MEIISLGQPFDMDDIPRFVENQYKPIIDKQELKSNPSYNELKKFDEQITNEIRQAINQWNKEQKSGNC